MTAKPGMAQDAL